MRLGDFKPFPLISDLPMRVDSFEDIVQINDFVFKTVPCTKNYFDHNQLLEMQSRTIVDYIYIRCRRKEIGGWCGLNVDFLHNILTGYKISSRIYNHGIIENGFTHVVLLVTLDSQEYVFDPYFNKYYTDTENRPLNFNTLLSLITDKKFDMIKSACGLSSKWVQDEHSWSMFNAEKFQERALSGSYSIGLENAITKKYGNSSLLNLLISNIPAKNTETAL